jgi:hypothetical protein
VKVLFLPLCVWSLCGVLCANARAEIVTARSSSGQFVAREVQDTAFAAPAAEPLRARMGDGWGFLLVSHKNPSDTDQSTIDLEPSLLVVTCERLKEQVLVELGLDDQWQGNVNLLIDPKLDETKRPRLAAIYDRDTGWSYNLELPKSVSTRVLVRALMDTLLLEMANRGAGSQCAEVPFWLVEGMSAQLQSFNLPTLILQPSEQMSGNRVRLHGLDAVRGELRRHAPLTFQELSWPTDASVDGDGAELYRSCAQLFLEQLLQFKDGSRLLREMLRQLPNHLNWQTAFLIAFRPHFKQLLDVEKWWGVSAVGFARGDLAEPLAGEACARELQDMLDVPVEVHFAAEHMPAEAKLTLQEVIAKWSPDDAGSAIDHCIEALKFLHLRASPEYRPLVDQYLKVLAVYLTSSRDPRLDWGKGQNYPPMLRFLKSDAIRQLDALDLQRSAMRPPTTATAAVGQVTTVADRKR